MEHAFDIVVIGTGVGGSSVAYKCQSAGWKIAIVDSRPFGGTCVLRGCDPKKVLVGAADAHDWNLRMRERGIFPAVSEIDWGALMRFKRQFTESVPQKREEGFARAGIQAFHGRARFTNRNSLEIGHDRLTTRHFVIASGAMPVPLGIPGEEYLTTSEQFLNLERLPPRVVFVGGGYISFEFAHVAAQAGAQVTILDRGKRPLTRFEPHLVDMLMATCRDRGMDIRTETAVENVEKTEDGFVVTARQQGVEQRFEADLVVHGAGRVPEIGDLGLDRAGIAHDRNGVTVNDYLQSTTNPSVYAAGDAAGTPGMPLTPVGRMEAEVAAENLLHGNRRKPIYEGIPTVVFTDPPLASVGMREDEAAAQKLKFHVQDQDTSQWYSSRRLGISRSGSRILTEDETDRILGAHLFGPNAEEVVNLFGLAIRSGLTAAALRQMVYSYPSSCSDIPSML